MVTLGALGAVTATAPADYSVQCLGWRGLFAILAAGSALARSCCCSPSPNVNLPPSAKGCACPGSLGDLSRLSLLVHGTAFSGRHWHVLVVAGPVRLEKMSKCQGPQVLNLTRFPPMKRSNVHGRLRKRPGQVDVSVHARCLHCRVSGSRLAASVNSFCPAVRCPLDLTDQQKGRAEETPQHIHMELLK